MDATPEWRPRDIRSNAPQNAEQFGQSTQEEVQDIDSSWALHLTGHDHESDNGRWPARNNTSRKKLTLPRVDASEKARSAEAM